MLKAIEYFVKEKISATGADNIKEWVHFGLTSQDINNTAIPLSWKHYLEKDYLPSIQSHIQLLKDLSREWKALPMLAHTHGQPASPTVLGKEIMVFVERLEEQLQLFSAIPFAAKFGGATGNLNAHTVAFPKYDWIGFANALVNEKLGLKRRQFTTQIEHYDLLAAHFDAMKRINNILLDFCRDIWSISAWIILSRKQERAKWGHAPCHIK